MEDKSLAMTLIKSKDKIIITLVICWLSSILFIVAGFLWYINQFDYSTESTATMETENNGSITTGDIDNG